MKQIKRNFFGGWESDFKFKANNGHVSFSTQICVGTISSKIGTIGSREVSLKGNVYNFWVDYNSIDKFNILNTHKYS